MTDAKKTTSTENGIVGEALIALRHEELKEMGINSVGHRLTILKSVYEIKVRQHVPLDVDHYIPLCTFDSRNTWNYFLTADNFPPTRSC